MLEYGNLRLDSGTRGQMSKGGGANNLFIWEWGRGHGEGWRSERSMMIECDWRTSVDDERCVTAVPDCVVCVCAAFS